MNIGYACLTVGVPNTDFGSCLQKNASGEKLVELHNRINPGSSFMTDAGWIEEAGKTWRKKDGLQKIHYSQQAQGKRAGSHSGTIDTDEFLAFCNELKTKEIDVMLEVKDKNLSAVKCLKRISE